MSEPAMSEPDDLDREIRSALEAMAADVEPATDAWDRVSVRLGRPRRRTQRMLIAAGAAAAIVLLAVVAAGATRDSDDRGAGPGQTTEPDERSTTTALTPSPRPRGLVIESPLPGTRLRIGESFVVRGRGCEPGSTVGIDFLSGPNQPVASPAADKGGRWMARLSVPATAGDAMPDSGESGPVALGVQCEDRGEGQARLITVVLVGPPAPVIDSPAGQSGVHGGTDVIVSGRNCAAGSTARVTLKTYVVGLDTGASAPVAPDGSWSVTVRIPVLPPVPDGPFAGEEAELSFTLECGGRSTATIVVYDS